MNDKNIANKAIEGAEEFIKSSGVSTAELASTTHGTDGLITPQDLSPLLTDLAKRKTSFFDRVSKTRGQGDAYSFNLTEEYFGSSEDASPNEMFYADGGLPVERTTKYNNVVNPYKDVGLSGSVTGRALRQMAGQVDLEAQEVKNTMQRVRQGIDWLSFWSRNDVNNSAGISGYKGLDQLITTNVIDAQGGEVSLDMMNELARMIAYQGGSGEVSHVFTSMGVGIDINALYRSQNQFVLNMPGAERASFNAGDPMTTGVQTVLGTHELVPSYSINPGLPYPQGNPYDASSAEEGVGTSTIFFLAMPYIEYRELLPMSKVDLATVADKQDFMVIESGTVALRAEPFCGKIINVAESTAA